MARHANDQSAKTSKSSFLHKPSHFNSTVYHGESHDFSSMALKRDDGDYYFEAHTQALFSALNLYATSVAIEESLHQQQQMRVTAAATDMDLIETAHAARDHECYDKILILMRHGEAKHNVFEREWVKKHGRSMEEANLDEDYPVDPMLTGKVSIFYRRGVL